MPAVGTNSNARCSSANVPRPRHKAEHDIALYPEEDPDESSDTLVPELERIHSWCVLYDEYKNSTDRVPATYASAASQLPLLIHDRGVDNRCGQPCPSCALLSDMDRQPHLPRTIQYDCARQSPILQGRPAARKYRKVSISSRNRCRDFGSTLLRSPHGGSGTPRPSAICGRPVL